MFSQFQQWGLTLGALTALGVAPNEAAQRARQMHRHRSALERIYGRVCDLAQLTRTQLEEQAREAGFGVEYLDLQGHVLRQFVARAEVERELRTLDAQVRAVTAASDWPALEEAMRRGYAPVLWTEGYAEYDEAVLALRRRILDAGYRVLPERPEARAEEVPC